MQDGTIENRYTVIPNHKPADPTKRYFVLDLSNPDARDLAGLRAYATACRRTGYPQLAEALDATLPPPKPYDRRDWVYTMRAHLDCQPGYMCELRRDEPSDLVGLLGCFEGELDGHQSGELIEVLWPDKLTPQTYLDRTTFLADAERELRRIQQSQHRARIIFRYDDHELLFLTEYVLREEWEDERNEEFGGW